MNILHCTSHHQCSGQQQQLHWESDKDFIVIKVSGFCLDHNKDTHLTENQLLVNSQYMPILDTRFNGAHSSSTVVSHVAQTGSKSCQVLLMTCRVSGRSPDGHTTQARALLDSASSTSFISERLAQHLYLSRSHRLAQIAGIAGISHQSLSQSVVHFSVAPVWSVGMAHEIEAMVLPKVTSDLPLHPVSLDGRWQYLWGLQLADPGVVPPATSTSFSAPTSSVTFCSMAGGLDPQDLLRRLRLALVGFSLVLSTATNLNLELYLTTHLFSREMTFSASFGKWRS